MSQGDEIVVAIIGSARIEENDPRWREAHELGRLLAQNGFVVMTGGYGGLMAAAAQGAFLEGGSTIGLPMNDWKHLTPDPAHLELRWADNYFERLSHLLSADYVIVLDGGIGTLSEMSLAWAIAQTEVKHTQVLILGDGIKKLLDLFMESLVISENDLKLAQIFDSHAELLLHLKKRLEWNEETGRSRG